MITVGEGAVCRHCNEVPVYCVGSWLYCAKHVLETEEKVPVVIGPVYNAVLSYVIEYLREELVRAEEIGVTFTPKEIITMVECAIDAYAGGAR